MRYYTLVSFALLVACSSNQKNAANFQIPVSLERCSPANPDDWKDTLRNFQCINQFTSLSESQLQLGDSPAALKISRMGMLYYPWDGRIQNAYKKSMDVFKNVTLQMASKPGVNCKILNEREILLKAISPDQSLNLKVCKQKLLTSDTSPLSKDQMIAVFKEQKISKIDKELEQKIYADVSSMLKYEIAKNKEDNFNYIMAKTINIWNGLSFHSFGMKLGKNTTSPDQFNLEVRMGSSFLSKELSVCEELEETFKFANGHAVECGGTFSDELRVRKLSLGTKDYHTFSESQVSTYLRGVLPKLLIFRLELIKTSGFETHYYLYKSASDRGIEPPIRQYISRYNNDATHFSILDYRKAKKNYMEFYFSNLNEERYGDLVSINFVFEPLLTFQLYKRMHETNQSSDIWRSVIEETVISSHP